MSDTPPPSFLAQWKAIDESPLPPAEKEKDLTLLTLKWTGQDMLHALTQELRQSPKTQIFRTPIGVLTSKFADVIEGYDRDDVFTVDAYAERMAICTGAFMLGMNPGPRYNHEHSIAHLATPGISGAPLARWVEEYAAKVVHVAAANASSFDALQTVAYPIPLGFVGHYLGVPGPDADTLTRWVQGEVMYTFNFSTPVADRLVYGGLLKTTASQGAIQFVAYLDGLINERMALLEAGASVPEDVLTRMIRMWNADPETSFDPIAIRRNLGGIVMGGTVAPIGLISGTIDSLLTLKETHPEAYEMTRRAAIDGDDALLQDCVLEAARLGQPNPPSMFRQANQDYTLARGTDRATEIRKGELLVLIMSAAMWDPDYVDQPEQFRPGRPSWCYTMFGRGQHECFGRAVGTWMLTYAMKALLRLPGLRRAPGDAGKIQVGDGVPGSFYAHSLFVEYDRFS